MLVVFMIGAQPAAALSQTAPAEPDYLVRQGEVGRRGGRLVVALSSEPKTLNPLTAVDEASVTVVGRMAASLIDIDRETQRTTPGVARSWTVSPDGTEYTLHLRRGLRFSDGSPFDADDVVFSFEAYLDPRSQAPQRDLLIVGGEPIAVTKRDSYTVVFRLAAPYAAADRLFDGFAMLPRHLLGRQQVGAGLSQVWAPSTPPGEIAGLGPFRLKSYSPGESLILERNPHYFKVDASGQRLPYLEEIVFLFVASDDVQVMRFQSGEIDMIARLSAEDFTLLQREGAGHGYRLQDLGPGLEYNFIFFNLNTDVGEKGFPLVARRQRWFRMTSFRQAISASLDRAGMVRLAFQGRGAPLRSQVTPGNRLWVDPVLESPRRSLPRARELLRGVGFSWTNAGKLVDDQGVPVAFSLLSSASNSTRMRLAAILQQDLKELGIDVQIVALETRALLHRVLGTHEYEACLLALRPGDSDPNGEIDVWLSSGATHLWHPRQTTPATRWEAEIDRLMRRQLWTVDYEERKRLYDRVQELVAEELPLIPLVSPNILVGAREGLHNFRPAVLAHYTLWNADQLFWSGRRPPLP
jgi:peptide/nickel transport system substrate-binding protein